MNMRKHIAVLGLIHLLLGIAQLGFAALFGLFGVGGGIASAFSGEAGVGAVVGLAGASFAVIIACFAGLTLLVAWGLMIRSTWGRWLGVIASVLHLLSFSWMSLLGIYGLWALLSDGAPEAFRDKR